MARTAAAATTATAVCAARAAGTRMQRPCAAVRPGAPESPGAAMRSGTPERSSAAMRSGARQRSSSAQHSGATMDAGARPGAAYAATERRAPEAATTRPMALTDPAAMTVGDPGVPNAVDEHAAAEAPVHAVPAPQRAIDRP